MGRWFLPFLAWSFLGIWPITSWDRFLVHLGIMTPDGQTRITENITSCNLLIWAVTIKMGYSLICFVFIFNFSGLVKCVYHRFKKKCLFFNLIGVDQLACTSGKGFAGSWSRFVSIWHDSFFDRSSSYYQTAESVLGCKSLDFLLLQSKIRLYFMLWKYEETCYSKYTSSEIF